MQSDDLQSKERMLTSRVRRLLSRCSWLIRVLAAAILGSVVRYFRRIRRKNPRIWRGMNGLHLIKWPAKADKRAGFPSRSVIRSTQPSTYALFQDKDFDVVLDALGKPESDWAWIGLIDLLINGDIWVAFFDSTFFPLGQRGRNEWVMQLLKAVGIKIIMVSHCMDVFYRDNRITRFDWVGRAQADYPKWDLTEQRIHAKWRTALFCSYADLVVGPDSTCNRFLPRRDVDFKWFPTDCDTLHPTTTVKGRTPTVIHAPQHRRIKGTQELLDAIAKLQQKGIDVTIRLIENVSREEALLMYREADIIADQFCMGAYGLFALEALALGKPVLTYLDQEHLGDPVYNLPIVNTNPDNLERVLVVLLTIPELRDRLGQAGRAAVEQYQSIDAMAEVWNCLYNYVWWNEPLDLSKTRHFSSERKPRDFSEDPAEANFWPVEVTDLLPQIHESLALLKPSFQKNTEL